MFDKKVERLLRLLRGTLKFEIVYSHKEEIPVVMLSLTHQII